MKLSREAVKQGMLLYVVTDRSWLGEDQLETQVEEIIRAGATFMQLREKDLAQEAFIQQAQEIKKVTDRYNIPFVINDNVDVALAVQADGIHVGQSDGDVREIRKRLGEDKIIGVSTRTVEQAKLAEAQGADYVGVGAVFGTTTKKDAQNVTVEELRAIVENISIPVVAIGGINEENITGLKGSNVDGVAVISAIFAKEDKTVATATLLELAKEVVNP
ncbi:MAG: thiamine phosphate synthase [Cellulosilyticaceae bacterium]